jgi:saccharopine dehydrogenase (NAD+, L-lysine-forming)
VGERRVLILGGYGETGRRLARLLVERTSAQVVVAGRDPRRAETLAAELGAERVRGIALDASDAQAVRRALVGTTLLANAASLPGQARALADAVMDAGADWLDLQVHAGQARMLEQLAPRIEVSGCCFVTQAGFHPGLPAPMVRWAAAQVDELETAWVGGLLHGPFPATAGLDELVAGFRDFRSERYRDGRWEPVAGRRDLPVIDFAFGFGRHRTAPWAIDELIPLPEQIPTLRELGFSIATNRLTDWIVTPAILAGLAVTGLRPRAVKTYGRLFARSTQAVRPPVGTVVQLDAHGRRGGRGVRLAVRVFHADGYELTAIPAASMLEQMLDGSARRPGLHCMGLVADPARLLADMAAMGVQVETNGSSPNPAAQPPRAPVSR